MYSIYIYIYSIYMCVYICMYVCMYQMITKPSSARSYRLSNSIRKHLVKKLITFRGLAPSFKIRSQTMKPLFILKVLTQSYLTHLTQNKLSFSLSLSLSLFLSLFLSLSLSVSLSLSLSLSFSWFTHGRTCS